MKLGTTSGARAGPGRRARARDGSVTNDSEDCISQFLPFDFWQPSWNLDFQMVKN